jgi:hypothetical protein
MLEQRQSQVFHPRERRRAPSSTDRSTPARMPGGDRSIARSSSEVERLRRRVRQQEMTLAHMSEALLALRRGWSALREENRELRLQLDAALRADEQPQLT